MNESSRAMLCWTDMGTGRLMTVPPPDGQRTSPLPDGQRTSPLCGGARKERPPAGWWLCAKISWVTRVYAPVTRNDPLLTNGIPCASGVRVGRVCAALPVAMVLLRTPRGMCVFCGHGHQRTCLSCRDQIKMMIRTGKHSVKRDGIAVSCRHSKRSPLPRWEHGYCTIHCMRCRSLVEVSFSPGRAGDRSIFPR